jgi:hypothetical protein
VPVDVPGVDHPASVLHATAGGDTSTRHRVSTAAVSSRCRRHRCRPGQHDGHDDGSDQDGGDDDPHGGSSSGHGDHAHTSDSRVPGPRWESCLAVRSCLNVASTDVSRHGLPALVRHPGSGTLAAQFGTPWLSQQHMARTSCRPRRGAVTVTVGLLAAAPTHRLPPPTCRSWLVPARSHVVRIRPRSRPARPVRVCELTRTFTMPAETLQASRSRAIVDSHLRDPDDVHAGPPQP